MLVSALLFCSLAHENGVGKHFDFQIPVAVFQFFNYLIGFNRRYSFTVTFDIGFKTLTFRPNRNFVIKCAMPWQAFYN